MNDFVKAVDKKIKNKKIVTENGMKVRESSTDYCLDFFYKVGALRGNHKEALRYFNKALNENEDYALRTLLWVRDVRGGAGERDLFRHILNDLSATRPLLAIKILNKIPEIGRFDDLISCSSINQDIKNHVFKILRKAIFFEKNSLAAKWTPRKGSFANEFRKFLGVNPKEYRKILVKTSGNTLETLMSSKKWTDINYSHVPSVAISKFNKAFIRNDGDRFNSYLTSLKLNKENVKVNTGAIYPYSIINAIKNESSHKLSLAQWEALPNYIGDSSILPMVDVSGSMDEEYSNNSSLTALEVAISLGLYCSDKCTGVFKDLFLTFSEKPTFVKLKGNLLEKLDQMESADWGYNTDLESAIELILNTAVKNKVPQEDMPKTLLILSDMQFDEATKGDPTALKLLKNKFHKAGYKMPQVVFWNLKSSFGVPAKADSIDVALISGFSPSILEGVLKSESITPIDIMLKTILKPKYNLEESSSTTVSQKELLLKAMDKAIKELEDMPEEDFKQYFENLEVGPVGRMIYDGLTMYGKNK